MNVPGVDGCFLCGRDDEVLHDSTGGYLYCVECCPRCVAERESEDALSAADDAERRSWNRSHGFPEDGSLR